LEATATGRLELQTASELKIQVMRSEQECRGDGKCLKLVIDKLEKPKPGFSWCN